MEDITMSGTTPTYHYYIQDHQGNNRVVFNQNGAIEQTNHYYPFGMTFGEGIDNSDNRYKYNDKELDRMHGLDWYDYGARMQTGMNFTTMDPLAEKYYSISPYAYCANNPIRFVDPDGKEIWLYATTLPMSYGVIKKTLSKETLSKIESEIPGVKWGFGNIKAWTAAEQKTAIQNMQKAFDDFKKQHQANFGNKQ